MDKQKPDFESFLREVDYAHRGFIEQLNEMLIQNGCSLKVSTAKNGYLVSYSDSSKKVILNFVFRKIGLIVRIYGDCLNEYLSFLSSLPDSMDKIIKKAPDCKRLLDLKDCNPKCRMGYSFVLEGVHFQKCRYNCFMLHVNGENNPFIQTFLENELESRRKLEAI